MICDRDMTKQEFYDRCAQHDWYYAMSDDHRVYLRGDYNSEILKSLAKDNEEFKDILSAFTRYYFTGTAFGTDQAPYPKRPDDD